MDVRLPDGTIIQGVPDGISKADLTAKLKANGYDVSGLEAQQPKQEKAPEQPKVTPANKPGFFDLLSAPFEAGMAFARQPLREQAKVITPTIEALGTAGGAALGSALGPVGTVGGAGAGYAAAKGLTRAMTGEAKPMPITSSLAQVGEDVLAGAASELGGRVAAPILDKAAKAAGWVWDAANGRLVQIRAGKIMREIAGSDLEAAKALAANAPAGLTAAQATAPVSNDLIAALGAKAAKTDVTNFFSRTAAEQEAARKAALTGVTPDLAASIAARDEAKAVAYGRARAADAMRQQLAAQEEAAGRAIGSAGGYEAPQAITPALQDLKSNPVIAAAVKTVRNKLPAGSPDPMTTLDGLHLMKLAIDNQFKNRALPTALQKFDDAALASAKQSLLDVIEGTANAPGVSPLYGLARQQFAEMSKPVDQATLLNAMQAELAKPGGGERVSAFLNALGRGENALLKRANQQPRFGGIEDVLTTPQFQTVQDIAAQMTRDRQLSEAAARGAGGLSRILGETQVAATPPPAINVVSRVANAVTRALEGRVNDKTLKALETGMRSGKDFLSVVNTLPVSERSIVLKTIGQLQNVTGGGVAGISNMLAPGQQNQNALAQ